MQATSKDFRRPALWKHPQVLWRRVLRSWPLLLWFAAIFIVIMLYQGSTKLSGIVGAVETLVEPIAPLETARLLNINVTIGQRVQAGDVVATMDTLMFDAKAAIDEAQMIEVEGTVQDYQQRILEFVHDFESATSQAQFDLESQRLNQSRDESVLKVLQEELARLEELRHKGLVSDGELAGLRPDIAALEQTVAAYPQIIAIHQGRYDGARQDEAAMRDLLATDAQDGAKDVNVLQTIQEMRGAMAEIIRTSRQRREIQRNGYTLRATNAGIVSRIEHSPGDVIPAGEPILRIVAESPQRVIGFLPEVHLGDVNVGDKGTVWRQTGDARGIESSVDSIAPEIEALPGRVSPIRGEPLRGRRIVLRLEGKHNLIPGETVRIQFARESPLWWAERYLGE